MRLSRAAVPLRFAAALALIQHHRFFLSFFVGRMLSDAKNKIKVNSLRAAVLLHKQRAIRNLLDSSRKGIEPISPTTIDFRVFRRALPCKVVLYGDKSQQNPSKIYSP